MYKRQPQSELDQVDHYEIHDLADRLLLMFRDMEDEEKRFFPSLRAIYDKPGGFPEAVEEIAGLLGREDSLQAILSAYEAFAAAYQDNPDIQMCIRDRENAWLCRFPLSTPHPFQTT